MLFINQRRLIQCRIHGFWLFGLWIFLVCWVYKLVQVVLSIRPLWLMRNFYHYLLDIPDSDIQTATWQLVVQRLMALRDANLTTAQNISAKDRRALGANSKQRMDAHDIANRVMRRDNYLIALFNKDIPNLTVPVPFLGDIQFFSRTMELLLETCVMQFVFDADGHVRREFLASKERQNLIDCLKQRFKKAAILSILIAPVSVFYFVVSYFFHYFSVSDIFSIHFITRLTSRRNSEKTRRSSVPGCSHQWLSGNFANSTN